MSTSKLSTIVRRHDRPDAYKDALHEELAKARTEHGKTALPRQTIPTVWQIDEQVYELYGLTEEEIKIEEGG